MSTLETPTNGITNQSADVPAASPSNPSIIWVKANENTGITKLNDHLTDTNYNTWKGQMILTLEICGIEQYAMGAVEKPNAGVSDVTAQLGLKAAGMARLFQAWACQIPSLGSKPKP